MWGIIYDGNQCPGSEWDNLLVTVAEELYFFKFLCYGDEGRD